MALKRSGIQLAMPFEERRILNQGRFNVKWEPPYMMQPKLNGERCRAIVQNNTCLLLSSTEALIQSVPHIQRACLRNLPNGEYDGELYVHGWSWAEIHGVVSRTTTLHENSGAMELHLFDLPSEPSPQLLRYLKLRKCVGLAHSSILHLVEVRIAHNLEEVYNNYDEWIDRGYEGFIIRELSAPYVRRRSGAMMKFKPKATDHYEIVEVYEAISEDGTPKGMVGGFKCIDDMKTPFSVGAGKLDHGKRKLIWEHWLDSPHQIVGSYLEVEYQTMSDKNKVPLFSRAVRII